MILIEVHTNIPTRETHNAYLHHIVCAIGPAAAAGPVVRVLGRLSSQFVLATDLTGAVLLTFTGTGTTLCFLVNVASFTVTAAAATAVTAGRRSRRRQLVRRFVFFVHRRIVGGVIAADAATGAVRGDDGGAIQMHRVRRVQADTFADAARVRLGVAHQESGGFAVQRIGRVRVAEELRDEELEDVHQVLWTSEGEEGRLKYVVRGKMGEERATQRETGEIAVIPRTAS